jgi:energy-coupling factor transporter ATP-binding protein EcfA2
MPDPRPPKRSPQAAVGPVRIATDTRTRASITLDLSRPRAVLATGKRGSGKTTSLHTLATAAAQRGATVVAIDPLGALLQLVRTAHAASHLSPQGVSPTAAIPTVMSVTQGATPCFSPLLLNPSDLTSDAWLALFSLNPSQPGGIALSRAVRKATAAGAATPSPYTIPDLIHLVEGDDRARETTQDAVINRLEAAAEWFIFHAAGYHDLAGVFPPGLHLVDLSRLDPGPASLRNLTVSLLVSRLFAYAAAARRSPTSNAQYPTWLIIDEAHNFTAPGALAALPLTRWAQEGRNLGLSLALATQRPATLPADIISQADVLIIHRLTLLDDVKAVSRLASTYARDLPVILKAVRAPGQAVIVDDEAERAVVAQVLRKS